MSDILYSWGEGERKKMNQLNHIGNISNLASIFPEMEDLQFINESCQLDARQDSDDEPSWKYWGNCEKWCDILIILPNKNIIGKVIKIEGGEYAIITDKASGHIEGNCSLRMFQALIIPETILEIFNN
jgi:hypothetical protein